MSAEQLLVDLARVEADGGPAQRAEARRILTLLRGSDADPQAADAARQLIDAYLHDPYLERT